MSCTADSIISQARAWLGWKESDGSFKKIIDIYNAHKPLARGYKVKYSDEWCATFISALAIKCGATDIIPAECGCGEMLQKFRSLGEWNESDSRTPSKGDIIFYDWDDSGRGDDTGWPDHVGIVEKVEGRTITVIEGNHNSSVSRRIITVNSRYIRGYAIPKYKAASTYYTVIRGDTLSAIAKKYGTTVSAIMALNKGKIKNADYIETGWRIRIR